MLKAKAQGLTLGKTKNACFSASSFLAGEAMVGHQNLPANFCCHFFIYFILFIIYIHRSYPKAYLLTPCRRGGSSWPPVAVIGQDSVKEMNDAVARMQVRMDKRSRKGAMDRAEEGARLGDHLSR